jgi:hypothetical protein
LVEQWLECVVILAVDEGHADMSVSQVLGGVNACESATYNDDVR